MIVRSNIRSLSAAERNAFVDAVLAIKKDGVYDRLVEMHVDAMRFGTPAVGPGVTARNGAHRGPSFLPWHRHFLILFERALRQKNDQVTLPYWNWTEDASDPMASVIWEVMGGNGDSNDGWKVKGHPFGAGHWELKVDVANGGTTLRRRLGTVETRGVDGAIRRVDVTLPKPSDVSLAMNERHYDAWPYNDSPHCAGFRNRLEGWITNSADPNVPTGGTQLHNRVHVFVGGGWIETDSQGRPRNTSGTMLIASSPNEPIFFLHHCYIDKLWADWQKARQKADPSGFPHYAPQGEGPFGHNLLDGLYPWGDAVTPLSTLEHQKLGYSYDTDSEPLDRALFQAAAKPEAWEEFIDTHFTTSSVTAQEMLLSQHDDHHGHGHRH